MPKERATPHAVAKLADGFVLARLDSSGSRQHLNGWLGVAHGALLFHIAARR
jgi:hypothetical protein